MIIHVIAQLNVLTVQFKNSSVYPEPAHLFRTCQKNIKNEMPSLIIEGWLFAVFKAKCFQPKIIQLHLHVMDYCGSHILGPIILT